MKKKKNIKLFNNISLILKRILLSRNNLSHKNTNLCKCCKNSNRKQPKRSNHSHIHACTSPSINFTDHQLFNIRIIILSSCQGDQKQASLTNQCLQNESLMASNIKLNTYSLIKKNYSNQSISQKLIMKF